jgi:hypothetical protein
LKGDAAVFILPACGLEIEIGERNFAGVPGREIKESLADDSIVTDFQLAAILEYEKRGRLRRIGIRHGGIGSRGGVRRGNVSHWRDIGIGAGSSAVEDGGTALIVVIRAVISVIIRCAIRCAHVDCVGNRHGVNQGKPIFGMVMAVRAAVTVARHV